MFVEHEKATDTFINFRHERYRFLITVICLVVSISKWDTYDSKLTPILRLNSDESAIVVYPNLDQAQIKSSRRLSIFIHIPLLTHNVECSLYVLSFFTVDLLWVL